MTPEIKSYCEKQEQRIAELVQQRDELLAAGEKAVSEMKAIAWDEEGYLLDPDLDQAADSLRAVIVKVKPVVGSQLRDGESK